MGKELEGIKVIEVGGAMAMPLAGMLMGSWGAEVIHVEPPGVGDNWRQVLGQGMGGWAKPHKINHYWEHTDRNKKSIAINLRSKEGQSVLHKLIASADVFLNNLRPYEMEKFNLTYKILSKMNPKLIYANVTGYGQLGPEKDAGGYDSVSLYNTATWVLGYDTAGCLITGEDALRPQRKSMGNPIRNVYATKDKRWVM